MSTSPTQGSTGQVWGGVPVGGPYTWSQNQAEGESIPEPETGASRLEGNLGLKEPRSTQVHSQEDGI